MDIQSQFHKDLVWSRLVYMRNMAFNSPDWVKMIEQTLGVQIDPCIVFSSTGIRHDLTWRNALDEVNAAIVKREEEIKALPRTELDALYVEIKEGNSKFIH